MKLLKKITIVLFCVLLFLPILKFDFTKHAVSEIDNRELAANPLNNRGEDFTSDMENYVNDRIGFRNEMIYGYTVLNDKLFGKMVHPSYSYGKDGYVFGAGVSTDIRYGEFHEVFADMVKEIQDYCEERGISFLFVFNPAKPAVMTEYLAEGINYNREWVDQFIAELGKRGIHYLDNTETLKKAKESGETVFNQKFDANHWNYKGAYYGTNAMLEELKKEIPEVHMNTNQDIEWKEEKKDSLLVSKFPIDEKVPVAQIDVELEDKTGQFVNELELDENYNAFGYYVNSLRKEEGGPKALVFQGSYMNSYGTGFLSNAFGEYIYVHDYQNILNFPYYMNIFKPDCVVLEVAEYTFANNYFDYEKMKALDFLPSCKVLQNEEIEIKELEELGEIYVKEGETLTTIVWDTDDVYDNIWLIGGGTEYDVLKTENGYTVTILTQTYQQNRQGLQLAVQ